ncbi:MAG: ribbon-helix-helix protein, CopG family [Nitrospira sp.]|nr:ribbon-helix-helix protein, CopG family [Nitrospira sp.]MDH5496793.1 ribbon-helix-helix protein, CopG family [Nitrospira sp.]MDH5724785.1 ribbon-helix-helix protein, CopG family [Nitrospira sp.]
MSRKTAVLGFSVTPEIAAEYEKLTARQKTTKSELFRRMVEAYKDRLAEEEFFTLQRKMGRRVRRRGPLTEEEVSRIVFEDR